MVAVVRRLWALESAAALAFIAWIPCAAAQSTGAVSGVVVDSVTRQPIARVLVSLGAAGSQLTDSSGRFSFPNVAVGSTGISFRRPGYCSPLSFGPGEQTITVTAETPPLTLVLAPLATLTGQVQVPEGDSPAGVRLDLYKATAVGGWRLWQRNNLTTAQPDGRYLFSALRPGSYLVYAAPSLDPQPFGTPPGTRSGYGPVFSPAAHDLSLASVYTLAAGQTAEVPVQLTRVPFYPVTIGFTGGQDAPFATISGNGFMDWHPNGRDEDDALHVYLPSGVYTLTLGGGYRQTYGAGFPPVASVSLNVHDAPAVLPAVTTVRQPPVTLSVQGAAGGGSQPVVTLQFVPAGNGTGAVFGLSTAGNRDTPQSVSLSPGRYHVVATAEQGYVSALTGGGTDLLSQPLTIPAGAATQITAAVRTDTGSLTVTLTGDVLGPCVLHVIPLSPGYDDRTETSSGDAGSFTGLPPGDYLVFATAGRVSIPFREPGILQQLEGQRVTVEPGGQAQVTLRSLVALPASLMDGQ